jgi:hypothetical protein
MICREGGEKEKEERGGKREVGRDYGNWGE